MDLEVKDVAELLNISETTILKWLADGRIPSYTIDNRYRFSRSEIEDWLMQQKFDIHEEMASKGNMQFSLYRALYHGEVITDLTGKSKEEIIYQTMQRMGEKFDLDPDVLTDLFMDREYMMSTALGHGIAVPHTRDFLLNTHYDVLLVVYPKDPIDFAALDGEPVHTLFFIFACEDRHHLNLLAKVAHINVCEKTRSFFLTRPKKEILLDFIKRWELDLKR